MRKETKKNRKELREVLVKKGCKIGGLAYRELIRILDDWYRKGI